MSNHRNMAETTLHSPATRHQANEELCLRMKEAGETLRHSLRRVIVESIGYEPRATELARSLRLDTTTASRLLRAIRASDPFVTLREIPSPQGIKALLHAASNASDAALSAASETLVRFESLLAEFPDGRAAFETALAGWLPDPKRRSERAARQSMYRSATQLYGHAVDLVISTEMIHPSSDPRLCDSAFLTVSEGIRRHRVGPPILVFGNLSPPSGGEADETPSHPALVVETIDGEREATDPQKFLLKEYCRPQDVAIKYIEKNHFTRFVLDRDYPPVNRPISLVKADVARRAYPRFRSEQHRGQMLFHVSRMPTRLMINDVLVHEDVYPGQTPAVAAHPLGLVQDVGEPGDEVFEVDRLDIETRIEMIGRGAERAIVPECPMYSMIVRDVLERLGWDPSRFRLYRIRSKYPMPLVAITMWFELPNGPD